MQHAIITPVRPNRVTSATRSTPRPTTEASNASAWSHAGARMMIATFFLVTAIANMGGESDSTLQFDPVLQTEATLILNAVIYSMAFALLVGRYVHIAAITLGLIMLLSSATAMLEGELALQEYWKDLVVVGALFALAITQGGSVLPSVKRLARTGSTAVVPRRVRPPATILDMAEGSARLHETRNHIARPVGPVNFASRRPG